MPLHAALGHVVVIAAPLAALLALGYALRPRARAALRWPLVAVGAATFGLAVWAGEAGGELRDRLERAAGAAGEPLPAAVGEHATGSGTLVVALCVLGLLVLGVAWGVLRPGRPTTTGARVASTLVAVAALAVLLTTATVLAESMRAVWSTHGLWPA